MKMNKLLLAGLLSIIVLIGSCKKDDVTDPNNNNTTKEIVDGDIIVYIANKEVYLINSDGTNKQQLTNDTRSKTEITLKPDKSRIAYLNEKQVPVIIDLDGNLIETLSDYEGASSIKWAYNDKTLFFLYNNKVTFYGTELDIPEFGLSGTYTSIDINSNNDIAYTIKSGSYTSYSYCAYTENDIYENTEYKYSYYDELTNAKWAKDGDYIFYYDEYYESVRKITASSTYVSAYNVYDEDGLTGEFCLSNNDDIILHSTKKYDWQNYNYVYTLKVNYTSSYYNDPIIVDGSNNNITTPIYMDW